jgi:hypothetical protein
MRNGEGGRCCSGGVGLKHEWEGVMDEGWIDKEEGGCKREAPLECGRGRHDLWRERRGDSGGRVLRDRLASLAR